jgi:hypothetical protein
VDLVQTEQEWPVSALLVSNEQTKSDNTIEVLQSYKIRFLKPEAIPFTKDSKLNVIGLTETAVLTFELEKTKRLKRLNMDLSLLGESGQIVYQANLSLGHESIQIDQKTKTVRIDLAQFGLKPSTLVPNQEYVLQTWLFTGEPNGYLLGQYPGSLNLN